MKGQRLLRLSHPEETRGEGAEVAKALSPRGDAG